LSEKVRKIVAVLLAVGLLASMLGLSACGEKTETPAEQPKEEITKGGTLSYYIGEPSFIDPKNAFESEGIQVVQAVFDSLTALDSEGNVVAAAAESWEPNSDATVWTFKLDPDDKFSDGTPVTAQDFVYAWNRIATSAVKTPETPADIAYQLGAIKGFDKSEAEGVDLEGLKAVDDETLEVTLEYAWADFPYMVAHPSFGPVQQSAVEKDPAAFAEMPVGNGPFKLTEPWKHNQYIKVAKVADYWGDEPNIDGVDFKIYKDPETGYRDFQAGNLDFVVIPEGQIESTKVEYGESEDGYTVNPGKQTLLGAETAIYYYVLNNQDPILKNAKLRAALSLAVNREVIAQTAYEGTRLPADSFVPNGLPGYVKGQWPNSKYDKAAAEKMLADAGYPGGQGLPEMKININAGAGHEKPAELIRSDWEAIGVKTSIEGLQSPQHWEKLQTGAYQIGRAGWIADYPIVDNFTYPEFLSTAGDNYSKYSNPEVDAALDKARATTDDQERVAAYEDIQSTIASTDPVIPIVWYAHHHVGSDRVNDLFYSNTGLADFIKVWIKAPSSTTK